MKGIVWILPESGLFRDVPRNIARFLVWHTDQNCARMYITPDQYLDLKRYIDALPEGGMEKEILSESISRKDRYQFEESITDIQTLANSWKSQWFLHIKLVKEVGCVTSTTMKNLLSQNAFLSDFKSDKLPGWWYPFLYDFDSFFLYFSLQLKKALTFKCEVKNEVDDLYTWWRSRKEPAITKAILGYLEMYFEGIPIEILPEVWSSSASSGPVDFLVISNNPNTPSIKYLIYVEAKKCCNTPGIKSLWAQILAYSKKWSRAADVSGWIGVVFRFPDESGVNLLKLQTTAATAMNGLPFPKDVIFVNCSIQPTPSSVPPLSSLVP